LIENPSPQQQSLSIDKYFKLQHVRIGDSGERKLENERKGRGVEVSPMEDL